MGTSCTAWQDRESLLTISGWFILQMYSLTHYKNILVALSLLCFHIISSSPRFPPSYLSSGAFSWFCGACHWSLAQASCRSCWWGVGVVWAWGPESGKPADLQRTSGYLSYLMHMYSTHTHTHTNTEEWKKHWLWMSFKISKNRHLTLNTKKHSF